MGVVRLESVKRTSTYTQAKPEDLKSGRPAVVSKLSPLVVVGLQQRYIDLIPTGILSSDVDRTKNSKLQHDD